jgi:hypothetical protein
MNKKHPMPEGLSELGQAAYTAIIALLKKKRIKIGDGKVFYSPAEWAARGERYGNNAELVIVYDGERLGDAFSYDRENYKMIEEMDETLKATGTYSEQCTTWYSAIYKA